MRRRAAAALPLAALMLIGPAAPGASAPGAAAVSRALLLPVPIVEQEPERCGPAALAMVMRFHGAGASQVALADSAYDARLRGALITDLVRVARRAGFEARVARLTADSLAPLLATGVPPVLLYRRGIGALSRQHYAVLVGWDPARRRWTLHDGGRKPRRMSNRELTSRWDAVGREALIVRPVGP